MTEKTRQDAMERLERRRQIDAITGCWRYSGAKTSDGYGYMSVAGSPWYVHRVSGVVFADFDHAGGVFVLHHCDQPDCFNPDHLFLGNARDNARDAASKGRMGPKKLTLDQVIEIKQLLANGATYRSIAPRFGVTVTTIGQIARGETWRSVPNAPSMAPPAPAVHPDELADGQ